MTGYIIVRGVLGRNPFFSELVEVVAVCFVGLSPSVMKIKTVIYLP